MPFSDILVLVLGKSCNTDSIEDDWQNKKKIKSQWYISIYLLNWGIFRRTLSLFSKKKFFSKRTTFYVDSVIFIYITAVLHCHHDILVIGTKNIWSWYFTIQKIGSHSIVVHWSHWCPKLSWQKACENRFNTRLCPISELALIKADPKMLQVNVL